VERHRLGGQGVASASGGREGVAVSKRRKDVETVLKLAVSPDTFAHRMLVTKTLGELHPELVVEAERREARQIKRERLSSKTRGRR
jgi:hypothetical protein